MTFTSKMFSTASLICCLLACSSTQKLKVGLFSPTALPFSSRDFGPVGLTLFSVIIGAMTTLKYFSSSDFIAVNYNDTTETRATYFFNLVWYDSPDTTVQRPMTLEFYDEDYDLVTIQTIYDMTQSPRGTQSRYGTATIFGNDPIFIKVINQSGETLDYHLFSQSINGIFADPDPFYTIESPGTADLAVAVGAWVTRNDRNKT